MGPSQTDAEAERSAGRLPAEPDTFIGRERDLAELRAQLATSRLITLCAPGGMGKTRLAVHLALEVTDEFDDGAWLVELAELGRPELVVARVADRLGVGEEPGRDRLDTLSDALRRRACLLVLDNCEHLVEAVAGLVDRLVRACPRLHVLTTSREPLHVRGEVIWRVPPLQLGAAGEPADPDRHEAIRLFVQRAGAVTGRFQLTPASAPDVARVCRALDGMPLAIELAAARTSMLSAKEIADRLDDRFRLLTTGDRTAPERQRTLRAAVDWSHDLLTPLEQALFRRVSVFTGGWSLTDAEQVCADGDLPAADILDLLAALVDKSLVIAEPTGDGTTRYRMLETIRSYAAERLADAGEATRFGHVHRYHFLRTREEIMYAFLGRTAPTSLADDPFPVFDRDEANNLAALSWSLEHGDAVLGLRHALVVTISWIPRGRFIDGNAWLTRFLDLGGEDPPPALRGTALAFRAGFRMELGETPAAVQEAETALALCRGAEGAGLGVCMGLYVLGMARLRAGEVPQAAEYFREQLAEGRCTGEHWGEFTALTGVVAVAMREGRFDDAEEVLCELLALADRNRIGWGRSQALTGLGILAQFRGDPVTARRHLEGALPWVTETGSKPEIARCLMSLVRLSLAEGDTAGARARVSEAVRLCQAGGQRMYLARALELAARLAAAERDRAGAVRLAAASAALRAAAGGSGTGSRFSALLDEARAELGTEAVDALWREGAGIGPDAAAELVLAAPSSPVAEAHEAADGGLTPRETEIARLVAGGLSNRAIAEELSISPATAARHIANIMAKLGYNSRTQIATWATRHPPPI